MVRLSGYRFLLLPIVGQPLIRYLHGHDPEISSIHATISCEPYCTHPGATICPYRCPHHASMRSWILALHDTSLYPAIWRSNPPPCPPGEKILPGRPPAAQSSGATLSPGIKYQLEIYPAYFFHPQSSNFRLGSGVMITS